MYIEDILKEILSDPYTNVTFTGGDPLYQVEGFTELAKLIKENSDKTIWLYTGFTMDQINASEHLSQILPYVDVVVDGPYIEELRDTSLQFRGSSNQNINYIHK
jgi:anaerobic ribonucleoside-triphosphate reductase activating protein